MTPLDPRARHQNPSQRTPSQDAQADAERQSRPTGQHESDFTDDDDMREADAANGEPAAIDE